MHLLKKKANWPVCPALWGKLDHDVGPTVHFPTVFFAFLTWCSHPYVLSFTNLGNKKTFLMGTHAEKEKNATPIRIRKAAVFVAYHDTNLSNTIDSSLVDFSWKKNKHAWSLLVKRGFCHSDSWFNLSSSSIKLAAPQKFVQYSQHFTIIFNLKNVILTFVN